MSSQDVSATFGVLVGATLEAVTFVMDYVQLQFHSAQLSAYTFPRWNLQAIAGQFRTAAGAIRFARESA